MGQPIIKLENYSKTFGGYLSRARVKALRDINLEIKKGERVCLFGPNGAGKSTILKAIMGLIKPSEGKAFVKDLQVKKAAIHIKRWIGFLPSQLSFFLNNPCSESLYHFAILRGLNKKKAKEEVNRLLELIGLKKWWDLPPKMMSSGMRQRFSLAMAIIGEPEIILFDEPVSFIDVQGKMKIYQLLQEYVEESKKTVIMSTHNIQEAMTLSNRIVVIDRGEIIADGAITKIINERCRYMEIILSEESPSSDMIRQAIGEGEYTISGRKILVKSSDALQTSIDIINRLEANKIPVFSYRPLIEQKRSTKKISPS
jgi:ABC-type multidrug transport system ATPase subunit